MPRYRRFKVAIAVAALSGTVAGTPSMTHAAELPSGTEQPPVMIEHIEGSDVSRIILTARAAERLDIQTEPIREQPVQRWRTLRGEVVALAVPPETAGSTRVEAGLVVGSVAAPPVQLARASPLTIRVQRDLDLEALGARQLASVLVVVADDDDDDDSTGSIELKAELVDDDDDLPGASDQPAGRLAGETGQDDQSLHYVAAIPVDVAVNLSPGRLVEVKVPLADYSVPPRVVPYSSVLYDTSGDTWVYTNPEPLVFVRERVSIDFIEGDLAILSEGPPVGAAVVTVGATELLGAEFEIGH